MAKNENVAADALPELRAERVLNASIQDAYRAWIDPEWLARWWGPAGFTNPVCRLDPQPGGKIYVEMTDPAGTVYPMNGTYDVLEPPKRLVFRTGALNAQGEQILEGVNEVNFEDLGNGKTRMRLHVRMTFAAAEAKGHLSGMNMGWNMSLDKLVDFFVGPGRAFSISRDFNAPRALVFKAHTDPVHLAQWLGPAGNTVIKAEMDLRPGGSYHYGLRMPDGKEMWGKQTYREIKAPEKLVFVQAFSDKDGGTSPNPFSPSWPREMLSSVTFEDLGGGKTRLTVTWAPVDATGEELAAFDGARGNMSHGFKGAFDQLDAYLKTL